MLVAETSDLSCVLFCKCLVYLKGFWKAGWGWASILGLSERKLELSWFFIGLNLSSAVKSQHLQKPAVLWGNLNGVYLQYIITCILKRYGSILCTLLNASSAFGSINLLSNFCVAHRAYWPSSTMKMQLCSSHDMETYLKINLTLFLRICLKITDSTWNWKTSILHLLCSNFVSLV